MGGVGTREPPRSTRNRGSPFFPSLWTPAEDLKNLQRSKFRADLMFVIFFSTQIFLTQIFLHKNLEQKQHKFQ